MAKAVLCPVCGGSGKYVEPFDFKWNDDSTSKARKITTCHGCGGRGWVEVADDGCDCWKYPYQPYWQPWWTGTYWNADGDYTVWYSLSCSNEED